MAAHGMFYFEVQTGLIRDNPPAVTNYYNYLLRCSARKWAQMAVDSAILTDAGLQYYDGFQKDLEFWVQKTERLITSAHKFGITVPPRAQFGLDIT